MGLKKEICIKPETYAYLVIFTGIPVNLRGFEPDLLTFNNAGKNISRKQLKFLLELFLDPSAILFAIELALFLACKVIPNFSSSGKPFVRM